MKFLIHIFLVLTTLSFLNSCGKKEKEKESHQRKEQHKETGEGHEAAATITSLTQEQIKAVNITFGNIEYKDLTATIKANGLLRVPNNNKANATSLYGGVIKSLSVELGDHVRKGQVIATIANPEFIQLQEEYLTIGSRITLAEQELQRQQELSDGNAGAGKNLQAATAEARALQARKASLYQQIQLMDINPNSITNNNLRSALVVTSPISGTVTNVYAKIGSYVDVSSPVVEVVDNGLLHLDLQVFEKDLPKVKIGQMIHFTITNNPTTTYTAKVFNIGSSFENESKTIAIHCTVTGNRNGLIDGMNITGTVSLGNVTTAAVPNEAIVEADGKFYIFIQTNKKQEEAHENDHEHTEAANHDHSNEKEHVHKEREKHDHEEENNMIVNFEKIEVVKGVSDMGYTAITPVTELPEGSRIVTKGAFFINAKLSNTGGHSH